MLVFLLSKNLAKVLLYRCLIFSLMFQAVPKDREIHFSCDSKSRLRGYNALAVEVLLVAHVIGVTWRYFSLLSIASGGQSMILRIFATSGCQTLITFFSEGQYCWM